MTEARAAPGQSTLRHVLHTIKGNLGCYGLEEIASLVHAIEDKSVLGVDDLDLVEATLQKLLDLHHPILGLKYPPDGRPMRPVEVEHLIPFLDRLAQEESPTARRRAVASFVDRLTWAPARALLAPLDGVVQRGAEHLEKDVELVIEGGAVWVDVGLLGGIFANLGHLVRNSLDHGIEPPDQRGDKPPRGRIVVRCREASEDWVLEVEDDGAGIDTQSLVRSALQKGLVTEAEVARMTTNDRLRLVFADGLSSCEATTILSGRGVGSASVLAAVEERGGPSK
ncbi:MAG: Hpt domain-containing protein [Myxococcales bacterium]|nr:Hpt domain-containing protein [Myxococcales bacterium]